MCTKVTMFLLVCFYSFSHCDLTLWRSSCGEGVALWPLLHCSSTSMDSAMAWEKKKKVAHTHSACYNLTWIWTKKCNHQLSFELQADPHIGIRRYFITLFNGVTDMERMAVISLNISKIFLWYYNFFNVVCWSLYSFNLLHVGSRL